MSRIEELWNRIERLNRRCDGMGIFVAHDYPDGAHVEEVDEDGVVLSEEKIVAANALGDKILLLTANRTYAVKPKEGQSEVFA
jgi:hypothetical protein